MPPAVNHAVATEMARLRDRYTEGINAGVELTDDMLPDWIRAFYRAHGAYERGLLLGVLLEEYGEMDDPQGGVADGEPSNDEA